MASTYGGVVVKANGLTLVVDITNRDTGTRPIVYSARNGTSTVALPATITTDTEFHVSKRGKFDVSVKLGGQEIATPSGVFKLEAMGGVSVISPTPTVFQEHGADNGTYKAFGVPAHIESLTASGRTLSNQAAIMRPWYAALANRANQTVPILCLGDSISEGQGATGMGKRWVERLRDNLRTRFPVSGVTGGEGYIGAKATGSSTMTWPATIGGTPTTTGTGAVDWGIKRQVVQMKATGDKVTYTGVTATSVDVCFAQPTSSAVAYYSIDGGAQTTFDTSNAGSVRDGGKYRITGLGGTSHSIEIGWSSGANVYHTGIMVYNGDESAGITTLDAGHYGWSLHDWLTQGSSGYIYWTRAVQQFSPALLVVSFGANDLFQGRTASQFQADLASLVSIMRTGSPGTGGAALSTPYPPVVVNMYYKREGSYTDTWENYLNAAYAFAAADGQAVVLDHTTRMYATGSASDALGLYRAADTAGQQVHPSDKGHTFLADSLTAFLSP